MDEAQSIDSSLPLLLLGILGMFLLAAAVVAFFIAYQKRLLNQQEYIRDLEKAYEQDLLKSAISAQERERKRIAIELHDGLGSLLSAVRLYIMQFMMKKSSSERKELVQETKSIVDTAITQTREISHNLLPNTLSRFGVIYAIDDYCKHLQKLQNIAISFIYQEAYQLSKEQDLAIYRIVQELINNTLKHAQASEIQIALHTVGDQLHLTYLDNGCGYDFKGKSFSQRGLGMKSIESRCRILNGEMKIQSAKGAGFQCRIIMPKLSH